MPIKLPKGFPRRKSSGNVLDEISNPKEQNEGSSTFKVLARPQSMGKSLDSPVVKETRPRPPPKSSFEINNEDLFSVVRGDAPNRSSDTTNSLITLPPDSAASSRHSNSSTNPSSVDSGSSRNVKPTNRFYEDHSAAQGHASKPSFLKNAGRTFSFGINKHNNHRDISDVPPLPTESSRRTTISNAQQRERSMTESSVSTAAPPRLDDHTFSIKATNDDDFGNMFAHLGTKSSRENLSSRPVPQSAPRAAPPRSIHVNKNAAIETSLSSWNSQSSRDGLMGASSPARTVIYGSPNMSQPSTLRKTTTDTIRSETSAEDNLFEDTPLHRSPEPETVKPYAAPRSRAPPSAFPTTAMSRARTQSTGNSSIQKSDLDASEYDQPAFDPALLANAQLASQYEHRVTESQHTPQSKVMTPAEFERYRQQKEDTRKYNKVFGKADSDDGSGDDYEDDEEDDREREQSALKQRKKQEAHLAVYRQQMMKVTGDAAPAEARSAFNGIPGSSSQLDLSLQERRMSQLTLNPGQYGAVGRLPIDSEPDEDEDVPLGILAAHGFPNKNKPPTRLLGSTSNPNLRSLAQTQGGASVAGDQSNRGSLPAFARHLPADPYYGASLVHQAERAPISMHANMSQPHLATQPQPSGAATAHPLHPAGLVGVIAGEERARAMRRGSPNAQTGQFDMPAGPQRNVSYQQPGMMMPQQPMTPAEQAQIQMSQSMSQMMQMQMQWMQQMTSMMGQNPNMPMPPMMGMPGMPQMPQMPQMQQNGVPIMQPQQMQYPSYPGLPHRPQSVPLHAQLPTHRTMSSLSPSMAGWNNSSPSVPQFNAGGSAYAHSIAPSERSNIGLSARYRPVTTATQEPEQQQPSWQKRASTFSSATFRPWTAQQPNSRPNVPTVRSVNQQNDDEDDEQAWAEMKARKDKKQKSWRLRKGGDNTLKELYNAPA